MWRKNYNFTKILKLGHSFITSSYSSQPLNSVRCQFNCQILSVNCWLRMRLQDMISRILTTGTDHQWNTCTSYSHYSIHSQLLFNNNNSFSVVYILAISDIFQISVLLELINLLTWHIVCLVKVIPLDLRVQVPAHLVRVEQWQMKRGLNVVIWTSLKISKTSIYCNET